ncbi:hypothetical protein M0805_009707 [Coniferiporia weirii]|nr:hypothetical protein M0805_009707 [Coniferiporia weirii]
MDIHLDTSWCPVCDRLILPKRYSVPISPPPAPQFTSSASSAAIKQSQTTRGKNGTIKARGGGGLVHGTGRARPGGGLRPNTNNKNKSPLRQEQQQIQQIQQQLAEAQLAAAEAGMRMRTVIDQSQTPLYCSDECRQADLEMSWPASPAPARDILDADAAFDKTPQLGAHPSQLNPAHASPPPPSPTLPPVPPNSWRGPAFKVRDLDLALPAAMGLRLKSRGNDGEHSDSSSATDASSAASDRSPSEGKSDSSNLFTDPAPPPLVPLPLHPHRSSAPAVPAPTSNSSANKQRRPLFEGGILMAARRLQELFAAGITDDEQSRAERRACEERERQEEELRRRWEHTGESDRDGSKERRLREKKEKDEQKAKSKAFDPLKWSELVYNYGGDSSTASSGVVSTHRHTSNVEPSPRRVVAPGAPSRTQSALELYAKYPLFARPVSSTAASVATRTKSSASLATSYAPAYGVTTLSTSPTSRSTSSTSTSHTAGLSEKGSALTLPGADPALYAGKRLSTPRRPIAKGVEGMLLVPEILLRPAPMSSVSASLPAAGQASTSGASGMRRSGSEASVSRKSEGKSGKRSVSTLGAVREGDEGVWHQPEDMSEDSRSSATSASERGRGKSGKSRKASKARTTTSEMSAQDRRRMNMETRNWSYDNVEGPVYDAMPPMPIKQIRFEEVFVPDAPTPAPIQICTSEPSTSADMASAMAKDEHIAVSTLHGGDVELSRRALREVGRRRGEHDGRPGWWIEKEWEVTVIPERKRLFLFGSGKGRTQ